jgi:glycosyltransferase involved in cell wall biosynthesis
VPARSLHIAWLGPVPGGDASARGVAAELLHGLAKLGHRIDCFFPAAETQRHARPAEDPNRAYGDGNVTFVWGTSTWGWDRWYSRTKVAAFATGLLARGFASIRLRREIVRRHEREPYDVIFQISNIESLAVPANVARTVPLVIRPDTHIAGELKWLIAERRLSLRCQPAYMLAAVAAIMSLRSLVQRVMIRRARLIICISSVFRDHLVHDYGVRLVNTIVIPNPVRLDRFIETASPLGDPPRILVLGRISVRKGIDDVVAVAKLLLERDVDVRLRVVGGPSLWSDYTKLLEDLPSENAEYAGSVSAGEIPSLLLQTDVLLQASKYEPFGLTVGEALAAGVPVVASTEVGAGEGVDSSVLTAVAPSDVEGMASAIAATIAALERDPGEIRARARAEAERLFAPEVVCEQISTALERLVDGTPDSALVGGARPDTEAGSGASRTS